MCRQLPLKDIAFFPSNQSYRFSPIRKSTSGGAGAALPVTAGVGGVAGAAPTAAAAATTTTTSAASSSTARAAASRLGGDME